MQYKVIGDLLAPSLFAINGNGQISVANDLKQDDAFSYNVSTSSFTLIVLFFILIFK